MWKIQAKEEACSSSIEKVVSSLGPVPEKFCSPALMSEWFVIKATWGTYEEFCKSSEPFGFYSLPIAEIDFIPLCAFCKGF